MAVLNIVLTLLDPIIVVAGLDTVSAAMDALVLVCYSNY